MNNRFRPIDGHKSSFDDLYFTSTERSTLNAERNLDTCKHSVLCINILLGDFIQQLIKNIFSQLNQMGFIHST